MSAANALRSPAWPPPPWRLCGEAVLRLQSLPPGVVASHLPPGLKLVTTAPGRAFGGLYLARYGAGSSLYYHELIVFALARSGLRSRAWITHIFVDDAASQAGGREIWGLNKRMASFSWTEEGGHRRIVVDSDEERVCALKLTPALPRPLPLPPWAPVWGVRRAAPVPFQVRGKARFARATMVLDPMDGTVLASLGLAGGGAWSLQQLQVSVAAP